jgi:hypothetical protein
MTALAAMQEAMQAWLLHGDSRVAALIDHAADAHRLRIYGDAYRLRLLDVLGNDFPATRATLGDVAFEALGIGYIAAFPSTQPSVRHLGHAFADWLSRRNDAPRGAHELARFEWSQGECFDAADAPRLAGDAIASLAPEAWPTLRLCLHPATRLLATRRLRLHDGQPTLAERDARIVWLLWRRESDVHWRTLGEDEAEVLQALRDGVPFGGLCERLATRHGEAGAMRAAALLKRWLADGLLAANHFDE